MSHYKSNVRDQAFNLFEVFGIDKALGQGAYADLDEDSAREMLAEISRLAEGPIADSFAEGDRNPPVFDPENHTVTLPPAFKKSVRALLDGGWDKIGLDEELGGMPMPRALQWALIEHILGANPAVYMYAMGAGFAQIMHHLGTEEQKKWAVLAVERGWTSTMVLTEPDAGSDVGAGRTKAVQQPDGTWHIDGVKRFITSGDADDLGENILHLVLARPEGAGPGTKGLSLFFVPKYHFDPETGEPGERNGVFVTNVEHKMGLKVSATCAAVPRAARRTRRRLARRRGARRHRADVRRHRAGPNDGGHQGHRDVAIGLGAHHHSGLLDDVEHLRDAFVHLADEPADGGYVVLPEGQLAGRGDLEPHLVLDVGDEDAVALAGLAGLGVEVVLRHEEQRQALGTGSGTLGAGQHQVQDVLAEIVGVTGGDEALHAVDVPGAVGLLDGLGTAGRTSEPASGSVNTMVEVQPRSTASTAHFFCSSVPR